MILPYTPEGSKKMLKLRVLLKILIKVLQNLFTMNAENIYE